MELESKEYSWKWITADELLCKTPCEICHVLLTCKGANCRVEIYDGEDTSGKYIARVEALANRSVSIDIHHHIYCERGLYLDLYEDTVNGVLVQWLEVPQGIGHP